MTLKFEKWKIEWLRRQVGDTTFSLVDFSLRFSSIHVAASGIGGVPRNITQTRFIKEHLRRGIPTWDDGCFICYHLGPNIKATTGQQTKRIQFVKVGMPLNGACQHSKQLNDFEFWEIFLLNVRIQGILTRQSK